MPVQFCFESGYTSFATLDAGLQPDISDAQRALHMLHIDPSDKTIAFQQWKDIIAVLSFRGRYENLNPIVEAK